MGPAPILGKKNRRVRAALISLGLAAAGMSSLPAGSIEVAWTPVQDEQLKGYRIHYGPLSRSYDQFVDLDPAASSHTLTGLADCQTWYVALTSVDQEGLESLPSDEIAGFTQPRVTSVSPDVILAGSTGQITLEGVSFAGAATAAVAGAQVLGVQVENCSRMQALVQVAAGTPAGSLGIQVMNPDGVPAAAPATLLVVTDPGPTATLIQPGDGATDVPEGMAPNVAFDRDLLPASVSPATVHVLDAAGVPVPQASGSPTLAGNTVTIRPAALLRQGARYYIEILGGTAGVKDVNGAPMAGGLKQSGGFLILDLPPGSVPRVRRTDTKPSS